MSATIHSLHPVLPIGHFLRVGHTGHRKLEDLHASGRLGVDRVVFDPAHIADQIELLDSLRTSENEIVLDTRMAELCTPGGYRTSARKLPWAKSDNPYSVEDFDRGQISTGASRIADFAVHHRVGVVLAPTRLLEGAQDRWLAVDAELCEALRRELDARDAKSIAIDYLFLITYQMLLDGAARAIFAAHAGQLPFDYLWLRIANFDSDKSAAGLRKYINAARDFHEIGKPIVCDGVGGLSALAVLAFGAAGGICHGVAEKERFYPYDWWKPRSSPGGSGTPKRVYFHEIDTYLSQEQARNLLATRGSKPLLGCRDTGCCPGAWEDMILNPKTHYRNQTTRRVADLGRVPDMRRADHFLSKQLAPADRNARAALRLKLTDKKTKEKLSVKSEKTDDMRRVLEELRATDHNLSRSQAPIKRIGPSSAPSQETGR